MNAPAGFISHGYRAVSSANRLTPGAQPVDRVRYGVLAGESPTRVEYGSLMGLAYSKVPAVRWTWEHYYIGLRRELRIGHRDAEDRRPDGAGSRETIGIYGVSGW